MEKQNTKTQEAKQEKDITARIAKFKEQVKTGLRGGAQGIACW